MDGILQQLLDVDEPIVIVVRHELHPAQQRLLVALGAGWVIDPVNGKPCARRCGHKECQGVSTQFVWKPNWIDYRTSVANVERRKDRGEESVPICRECGCETDKDPVAHSPKCPTLQAPAANGRDVGSRSTGLDLLERMDAGEPLNDDLSDAVEGGDVGVPLSDDDLAQIRDDLATVDDESEETPGGFAGPDRAAAEGPLLAGASGVSSDPAMDEPGSEAGPAAAAAPQPEEGARDRASGSLVDRDGGASTKRGRGQLQGAILDALVGGMSTAMEIGKTIGTPAPQVSSGLRVLVDKGLAEKVRFGVYRPTDKGRAASGSGLSLDSAQRSEEEPQPGDAGSSAGQRNAAPASSSEHDRSVTSAWSDDEILAAIRRWADEHGQPPTANEWMRRVEGFPSATTVTKRFGSWANAIERAGFPRPRRGGVTAQPRPRPPARIRVPGTGLSYESPEAAYLAADEIEADGVRVAEAARFDRDEAKAEQALDQSRDLAGRIRDAAHAFEARRGPAPAPPAPAEHLLVRPEEMAPFQRSLIRGLIAGMRAAADELEGELGA